MIRANRLLYLGRHVLLTFCLLLLQQASVLHAFQHARAQDESPTQHTLCKECLAYSALDHAVASNPLATPTCAPLADTLPEVGRAQCTPAAPRVYLSRAPPGLSRQA